MLLSINSLKSMDEDIIELHENGNAPLPRGLIA
jgi:hypothetical protein